MPLGNKKFGIIMSTSDQELLAQIAHLVDEALEENVAIKGISIGTEIATTIYSKFKSNTNMFNDQELIASATSFQYISQNLFTHITKNNMKTTFVTVDDFIVLIDIVKEVSAAMVLDRKFAEMEGIQKFQHILGDLLLKVSAFVETSGFIREDPLVRIMRAVPSAFFLALISKDGLPIKIIDNGNIQGPMVGSQVSALSNLTEIMLKQQMDYALIQGKGANIMVLQFDSERILALSIPEHEKPNIGQYMARIKEIISSLEDSPLEF